MGTASVQPRLNAQSANDIAIASILATSIKKRIKTQSYTVVPANVGNSLIVPLRNVGILRGCLVKCTATVANTDGATDATTAEMGPANMWATIFYTDFSNVIRIQTTGAHLFMVDSVRRQGILGAAYTNDNPGTFGAVWTPIKSQTITHGSSGTVISYHWVPATYSDEDFRGAVFSNITNASQSLTLVFAGGTPGSAVCIPTGTDSINAMFTGPATASVSITTATIQVYQDVWDQLPSYAQLAGMGLTVQDWQSATADQTGILLPNASMRWIYEFKNVPQTGIVVGDNLFLYTNNRQFLSTIAEYLNPTRTLGTDINFWQLIASNSYEFWNMDPLTVAFETRRILGDDFPKGFYLFDTRTRVINTVVSGNIALNLNAITATAGQAQCNLFFEDFALSTSITGATSLNGN